MLIISQRAWSARDTAALAAYIEGALKLVRRRQLDPKAEPLLLLPQAVPADDAPEQDTLLAALGDIAASEKVMLAGAAGVAGDNGVATIGFLLSAEGEPLLTAPKVSPDLVTGFGEDATAATGQPAEFKSASTSVGQVGILPGEDVLFAHYARALTWAGAEIILNPVAEVGDHLFESRRNARRARAWENTSYVAVAGAVGGTPNGPACSSLIDFAGATTHAAGGGGPAAARPRYRTVEATAQRHLRRAAVASQGQPLRRRLRAAHRAASRSAPEPAPGPRGLDRGCASAGWRNDRCRRGPTASSNTT